VEFEGLAHDPGSDVCYAADANTGTFVRIDLDTARATFVGPGDDEPLRGLAFHPDTGTLYGIDEEELFTVDLSDGRRTTVGGTLGALGARGLAFDPARNAFLTYSNAHSSLVTIDPATGLHVTVVTGVSWSTTVETVRGMAMVDGILHAFSGGWADALHQTIDPVGGATALVSVLGPRVQSISVHAGTITILSHLRILLTVDGTTGRIRTTVELSDPVGTIAHDIATGVLYGTALDSVTEPLTRHGFSLGWVPTTGDRGEVRVTCRLTHAEGHSEETTLVAPPDTSGLKNPAQAIASTITLLQRYTALSLLGIATADTTDPTPDEPPQRIDRVLFREIIVQ